MGGLADVDYAISIAHSCGKPVGFACFSLFPGCLRDRRSNFLTLSPAHWAGKLYRVDLNFYLLKTEGGSFRHSFLAGTVYDIVQSSMRLRDETVDYVPPPETNLLWYTTWV